MKRILTFFLCWSLLAGGIALAFSDNGPQIISSFAPESTTEAFKTITAELSGDWQQYGEQFTHWQATLFGKIFLLVITIVPVAFLLHFLVIGPKEFDHSGPQIYIFGVFTRFVHLVAAVSFSLLVITGLMIIFGSYLGGGGLVRMGRTIHIVSALVGSIAAVPMFFIWIKDMFPAPHDIAWFFVMGGYLSKEKKPVPAGKFNAGQKTWFWLATIGTLTMAYTGYIIYAFQGATDQIRLMAVIHNFLGALLVAFFITHLYMAVFAIKGALSSMINGYKPKEELEILHSRFKI